MCVKAKTNVSYLLGFFCENIFVQPRKLFRVVYQNLNDRYQQPLCKFWPNKNLLRIRRSRKKYLFSANQKERQAEEEVKIMLLKTSMYMQNFGKKSN